MNIQKNVSLKPFNTFGIDVLAKEFVEINTDSDLHDLAIFLAENPDKKRLILGGGSNVLFREDFDGIVVKMNFGGIGLVEEIDNHVLVKAHAGENWHDFVTWTLQRDFGGLENLSLIPGNVGAAPMQNIGAYGVEVKDLIETVEALEIETGEMVYFSNSDCQFGYRDSLFKQSAKGKFLIVGVIFRLSRHAEVDTTYGAISSTLEEWGIEDPDIHDVSRAVIYIRQSKLPDPEEIGNGGSFFKNPVVDKEKFEALEAEYPEMPYYEVDGGSTQRSEYTGTQESKKYKIPAGWLIEQCGWKGKRVGECGVHERQALVLVNYGDATGQEIYDLAKDIQNSVEEQFGIALEMEVNVV